MQFDICFNVVPGGKKYATVDEGTTIGDAARSVNIDPSTWQFLFNTGNIDSTTVATASHDTITCIQKQTKNNL